MTVPEPSEIGGDLPAHGFGSLIAEVHKPTGADRKEVDEAFTAFRAGKLGKIAVSVS